MDKIFTSLRNGFDFFGYFSSSLFDGFMLPPRDFELLEGASLGLLLLLLVLPLPWCDKNVVRCLELNGEGVKEGNGEEEGMDCSGEY